jgi:hypothetical protein
VIDSVALVRECDTKLHDKGFQLSVLRAVKYIRLFGFVAALATSLGGSSG